MIQYKSLQYGRAIAALLVVLHHLSGIFASEKYFKYQFFEQFFYYAGELGVVFFFSLSGFILARAHGAELFQARFFSSFLKKRLLRIYPSYWVVLLLTIISVYLLYPSKIYEAGFGQIFKYFLLYPFFNYDPERFIAVAWSLEYEVFFYLIFAAVFLLKNTKQLVVYLLSAILLMMSAVFFDLLRVQAITYTAIFFLGSCASLLHHRNKKLLEKRKLLGLFLFCILAIIWVSVWYEELHQVNPLITKLLYGVLCAIIVYSMVMIEDAKILLFDNQLLIVLGNCSYATYLIHFQLAVVLSKLFAHLVSSLGVAYVVVSFFMIAFIVHIIGYLYYKYIEKKITLYVKSTLSI
jgi:peptidoglycan/LPS O-acetylase OafA/YrhL